MAKNLLLPQNDTDDRREEELKKWREKYFFQNESHYPMANLAPPENKPDFRYSVDLIKNLLKRRAAVSGVARKSGLKFEKNLPHVSTAGVSKILVSQDTTPLINYFLPDLGPIVPSGKAHAVADYDKVFQREPPPPNAKGWDSDAAFAYTYLGGADPDVLKRMNAIPPNFPITNAHFKAAKEFASDDLPSAIREGRVYFVDYAMMKSLKNGQHPQYPKYMFAPIAAFAVPRGGKELMPFAIQTGQEAAGREIYTPADGWSWKLARSAVQVATNAHSAIITHLSLTHLTVDPIALSTFRQLSDRHPLGALLRHHFVNTLHINYSAFKSLVGKNQFVDRMLGSEIESNYDLIASNRLNFDFKANYLPTKLAQRQTTDKGVLKIYPYRDDGMLLWNAIHGWMSDFVTFYYKSERDLLQDAELQAWAKEISAQNGGQLRNFASNGGVASRQELIDTLTMIIFTVGPQHAVVNFSQRTDMAYIPAAPMASYTPEMKGKSHSEKDFIAALPPLDVANVQLTLCYLLGSVYYGTLGNYGAVFTDPTVKAKLAAYNSKLTSIEATINEANRSRRLFEHMLPSKVPQSINI